MEGNTKSLRCRIDEAISISNQDVLNKVHAHFVSAEIDRRANLLVVGINTLREAETDLKKINRADDIRYDGSGTDVHFWTKGRLEEIKKAHERVERLETALDRIIGSEPNTDDFNKPEQAIKKG